MSPPAVIFRKYVSMKVYLGEFEELVLLTIAALGEDAYGVLIQKSIEERSNRSISIGALHSTITRLEEKGFLTSEFGEVTSKRGGKRKRIYATTSYAHKVLAEMKDIRAGLWESIPTLAHQLKLI